MTKYDYLQHNTSGLLVFITIHDNPRLTIDDISNQTDIYYTDVCKILISLEEQGLIYSFFNNDFKRFILTEEGTDIYNSYIDSVTNPYLWKIKEYKSQIQKQIESCETACERTLLCSQLSVLNDLYCDFSKEDLVNVLKKR